MNAIMPVDLVTALGAQEGVHQAGVPADVATPAEAQAFSRAAAAPSLQPSLQIDTTMAAKTGDAGPGMMDRITSYLAQASGQLDAMKYSSTHPGQSTAMAERTLIPAASGGPASPETGLANEKALLDNAVAGMGQAYEFAIEMTLASRGSTESTKIFNSLLKGQ